MRYAVAAPFCQLISIKYRRFIGVLNVVGMVQLRLIL